MPINMTIDEALTPTKMTCTKCGGQMKAYPCPIPEGIGFCPNCSPSWLESFAKYLMNQERIKHNLKELQ